jgi:NAD(P)-dependent dehydrogenase (short-subunit alcohol dehydrogenase family)
LGVLVTGGAGYIGSHMALELLDAGEEVLVLDNLSTGFRWAVPDGAKLIEGDVGNHDLVRGLLNDNAIDAVLHFAGSIVVPESVIDPLGYYLDNTDREEIGYGLTAARGITGYAAFVDQIDDLRANSLDFYGALRSLYRQRRKAEINNGGFDEMPNIDPGLEKRTFPPIP